MGTPPRFPPHSEGHLEVTSRKSRQSTWLRRLTLRSLHQPRQAKFDIPEAPNAKKKVMPMDYLQEQTMQGTFVSHGRDDILSTAIGRSEHLGRVRLLAARVSIKGNNVETIVNPSGEEHVGHMLPTTGLQAFHTFITWSTNLVKIVSHEDSSITPKKVDEPVQRSNKESTDDPLRRLIRSLFMDEWSSSLGHASMYGFLEPQSIHNAKDRHTECQQYIETWVKESQREVYLGAYLNHAMKTLKTTVDGKTNQSAPQWIEVKWFGDGTPLDKETITTICNKWVTYFVKVKDNRFKKI
ncbi:hypothetical protein GmHk_04G011017 [Glycine max]|nr:hypothetical protein GmHk_04G011017 [Glycine max]